VCGGQDAEQPESPKSRCAADKRGLKKNGLLDSYAFNRKQKYFNKP